MLARGLRRILEEAEDPDRIRELVGDLILLETRFEEVPADLPERLGELRREAIRCPDAGSFLDRLEA